MACPVNSFKLVLVIEQPDSECCSNNQHWQLHHDVCAYAYCKAGRHPDSHQGQVSQDHTNDILNILKGNEHEELSFFKVGLSWRK